MEKMKLQNVSLGNIAIEDLFWNKYIGLVEETIIPFQWELINDNVEGARKSYCIKNFKVASGLEEGTHQGVVFQDTDVAKWLEEVAYSLTKKRNSELELIADQTIDLIAAAQCDDGYLNTYYTIGKKERWKNLFEGHELYTAGHMIEAAVAYFEATGKRKFLEVVCRFSDYIYQEFGAEEGKIHGYPGHPEIELALIKLFRVTKEIKYLELANYFVRARGQKPCYFLNEDGIRNKEFIFPEFEFFDMDYCQAHVPIEMQKTAEGHAVRAVYLYSAMADLAYEYQDKKLLEQCDTIWKNIVDKRLYITGSIGSASFGERFTTDYDLPNNTNYSESCATIGLAMFSNRMFQITRDGKYMDTVENALYNTLLAGIAMDGKHFFYVNPLEVVPEITEKNPTMRHIMTTRQQWFGVACCPPNIGRTLASLGNYIYAVEAETIYVNLFIGSSITAELSCGSVNLEMHADYPISGEMNMMVSPQGGLKQFAIAIRNPHFSKGIQVKVNGDSVPYVEEKGYIYLRRDWNAGDEIQLSLDIPFRFVRSNPRVRDNIGKVCIMKGPWVYCLEEADNGDYLSSIEVDTTKALEEHFDPELMGGTLCAMVQGRKIDYSSVSEALYGEERPVYRNQVFKAIPYCNWNNRGKGEMQVWVRELR